MYVYSAICDGDHDQAIERIKRGEGVHSLFSPPGYIWDKPGRHTILHVALDKHAPYSVIQAIFEAGFKDVNALNGRDEFALQYVELRQHDIYECCLKHGAAADQLNKYGRTELFEAIKYYSCCKRIYPQNTDELADRMKRILMLLRYGADPYHPSCRPIQREWRKTCTDPFIRFIEVTAHLIKICTAIQCKGGEQSVLRMLPMELIYLLASFMR